jgi:hypothetical protein
MLVCALQTCFNWVWCQECHEEGYSRALTIVWRLLICVTLFAAANFLKCALARMLSYSFYRTAHFAKVRDAIERELYLIRLSQARSTLLPPPAPEPFSDVQDQQDGVQRRAGGWGSTVWCKTSQAFLGQYVNAAHLGGTAADQEGCLERGADAGQQATAAAVVSAFAEAAAQQQQQQAGGMRHVSSADRIAEDAAVHVQLRQFSDTAAKQRFSPGSACIGGDNLLHHQQAASNAPTPKISWLQADLLKPHQQRQHMQPADLAGRQHSDYELFAAERMPSILGGQQQSRSGSKAGSRAGSRVGQGLLRGGRTVSKYSTGSTRSAHKVSLPGMVAGVDGLLLQPEVLGAAAGATDGQVCALIQGCLHLCLKASMGSAWHAIARSLMHDPGCLSTQVQRRPGQPMTPEELGQLRSRLGVNTFGTFVDR